MKQIIKYHSLEQYEDALENIMFSQKPLHEFSEYFVKYMLDFETKESNTLLNIDGMADPFNYKLNVLDGSRQKQETVDLVETYNYLLGLHLSGLRTLKNDHDKDRRYIIVEGECVGHRVVVIWRSTIGIDLESDRGFILNKVLKPYHDEVHVNGNSLVKNAVMIEARFKQLMGGD